MAWLRSGDGPLSVRARPSSIKRDCDRRATSTGEKRLVNVHAKSRLTPEPLRTLRPEDKGQAGACPDRTRAIPCMVRAVTRKSAPGPRFSGALQACPPDVPEPPSTVNGRHQQQPVNLKLAQGLNPRATHENTLVMRRSLVILATARRAISVPLAPGAGGTSRALTAKPPTSLVPLLDRSRRFARWCSTVANTAAKPTASYRREATSLEHRPRRRPLLDGRGRLAHSYGLEGHGCGTVSL